MPCEAVALYVYVTLLWEGDFMRVLRAPAKAFEFRPRDFATRKILTLKISPPIGLTAPGGSRWALPQSSSFVLK